MNDPDSARKELIYRVVQEYLRSEDPEELEELEEVFEVVYPEIQAKLADLDREEAARESDTRAGASEGSGALPRGLRFDSPFAEPTLIVAVTWLVSRVVHVVEERSKRQVGELLQEILALQREESQQTRRLRKILPSLARMADELQAIRRPGGEPRLDQAPAAADLVVIIHHERRGEEFVLRYQLWVQSAQLEPVGEVVVQDHPLAKLEGLFKSIQQMSLRDEEARQVAEHHLEGFGATLAEELLPEKLRQRLWTACCGERPTETPAPTLLLLSDETWVPWELLRLCDPEDGTPGPFLVEAFALTRWLHGPVQTLDLPVRAMGLVVPGDSGLELAPAEKEMVHGLETEGRSVTDVPARLTPLIDAFASGRFDAWHFSGHGLARDDKTSYLWGIQLEAGQRLMPSDLATRARGLGDRRPLIFLNACHGARGGFTLTGIGGLAQAFLKAGAGAFLSAHWALVDEPALAFARSFYERFLRGEPMGEAVRSTRRWFREQYPGDPTWLAYAAFAHPQASVDVSAVPRPAIPGDRPAGERQPRPGGGDAGPAPAPGDGVGVRARTVRLMRHPLLAAFGLLGALAVLALLVPGVLNSPLNIGGQEMAGEPSEQEVFEPREAQTDSGASPARFPHEDDGTGSSVVETLDAGKPVTLSGDVVVTANFRETLGTHHVELILVLPGAPPERLPVRAAPAMKTFRCGALSCELQVMEVDWAQRKVRTVIRSFPQAP